MAFEGAPIPDDREHVLLYKIARGIWNVLAGGIPASQQGGLVRAIVSTAPTSGGTVDAGAKSVSFVTSSDFSGTINGAAFPASAAKSFTVISPADTHPAIPYTISAGTLYIDKIL